MSSAILRLSPIPESIRQVVVRRRARACAHRDGLLPVVVVRGRMVPHIRRRKICRCLKAGERQGAGGTSLPESGMDSVPPNGGDNGMADCLM